MTQARLFFQITSFWHAGTGRGEGPTVDATVARTAAGLPYLPGRTVKGLLRQAVELGEQAGALEAGIAAYLFGTGLPRQGIREKHEAALEEMRFATKPGVLAVSSAVLGSSEEESLCWQRWAESHRRECDHLFLTFASTKIDDFGLAQEKTLRVIETTVPMTLCSLVSGPQGDWCSQIERSLLFLTALGSHRNRGLGRVRARLEAHP